MEKDNLDDNKVITEIVETGSDITGSVGGALIGGLIAGPIGIIIGGASGPLLTKTLKIIGNNIKQKVLTNREEVKIGAAYYYAIEQFNKNIEAGGQTISPIINLDFFGRNASEEVLEGVILTAQKTYEERKIKYIGKLYANLFFTGASDLALSNFMISLSNDLTYRQYIIINIITNKALLSIEDRLEKDKDGNPIISRYDLCCEIRTLKEKGLLSHPTYLMDIEDNSGLLKLNDIGLTKIGEQFYQLLSLSEIDKIDIDDLIENMNN